MEEYVNQKEIDARFELEKQREQTELEIKKIKATAGTKGEDVNTGNGSRTRETDSNGNRPFENNWDTWNKTH
jgi:hypothetical protein